MLTRTSHPRTPLALPSQLWKLPVTPAMRRAMQAHAQQLAMRVDANSRLVPWKPLMPALYSLMPSSSSQSPLPPAPASFPSVLPPSQFPSFNIIKCVNEHMQAIP